MYTVALSMDIKNELPPNYELIKLVLPVTPDNIYCHGDTIYNPSGAEIPDDILFHEHVHKEQQGDSVDLWWNRYLMDKDSRYEQELEAYAKQFILIKRHFPAKAAQEALTELAKNLSTLYNLDITLHQAETSIRHKAKEYNG